ncbi:MAG TPA: TonB-dependent receptor, partial [Novosphingobium sp.]|nr:TonB-dependent receptor [Novosphingobium sp.]
MVQPIISSRASASFFRNILLCGAAAVLPAAPAFAEDALAEDAAVGEEEQLQSSREIVVQADIGYRNRSEEPAPTLVYGEEYFQRFEPLTAGDALKRVPSVTFLSDVIESDGARLRGLDPGYTQILINGEKVPGSGVDRSFFLDRIPAELIKQVEIIRSSSARRTGDAVAGSLNIVLRDAYTLDGGYVRGGGLHFDDGEIKPTVGVFWGGQVGPGRLLIGANVQGRYNPKKKLSLRFGDSPENNPDFATEDFDNREVQSDTRDGTDYAANIAYGIEGENTKFEISGNYVRTDRTESERSFEYDDPTAIGGSVGGSPAGHLLSDNANVNDIDTENYSVNAKLSHEWSLGKTSLKAGYARFDDKQDETEFEIGFEEDEPEFEGTFTKRRLVDKEFSAGVEHEFPIGESVNIVFGGFYQDKDRGSDITGAEQEDELPESVHGWDQFASDPTEFAGDFEDFEPEPGGLIAIEEMRKDLFALIEGDSSGLKWEAGVRWENTSVTIDDATVDPADARTKVKYDFLLPSASLKWDTGAGRITASVARTLRRPRFDYITPALFETEFGDNDLLGNPLLKPESAWGGDLGYEHKIGTTGVIGVNVFYRKVKNLTELVTLLNDQGNPIEGSEGPGSFIRQPRNVGDGEVYGIEFDMSASLSFLGLPDTGVFGNLSLIDSKVDDFI